MIKNILFAGFGGQGILFSGKITAYTGLLSGENVSWLPSYGPEMRGGTANCSVCISDVEIGCPMVLSPDNLIVMNIPSYDKFIDNVVEGGNLILDSSLIDKKVERDDINVYKIPATLLSKENNLSGLANIIILGKFLKETGFSTVEVVKKAIEKSISSKKMHLLESNFKALEIGYNYI